MPPNSVSRSSVECLRRSTRNYVSNFSDATVKFPTSDQGFVELMQVIDRELSDTGYDIPRRPLAAVAKVSDRFGMPLPLAKPPQHAERALHDNWPVSQRIRQWYDERYGDRIKVDWTLGRVIVQIDRDLWSLRVPRIFGSAHFIVSRTPIGRTDPTSHQGPARCNVVELIDNMTASRMQSLTDLELRTIFENAFLGIEAFSVLEASSGNDLVDSARGDFSVAATLLMSTPARYGESKWASLQAAEKTMKATIALSGSKFSHTHNLAKLARELNESGIHGDLTPFVVSIQCSAGIRYGEEPCSQNEAVAAHHASLGLVKALLDAESGLQSNLAIRRS